MKKTVLTLVSFATLMLSTIATAQNTAINSTGTAPDASAMLDVSSTTKGLLTPRMTAVQRAAISTPATGLIVYQTDGSDGYYYYDGSSWVLLMNTDASNLASGTVPTARLGSGTADNTTYLRGDGTWATPSSGSSSLTILTKAADYTITTSDAANDVILTTSALVTITLPSASAVGANRKIYMQSTTFPSNQLRVIRSGSDTINGSWMGSGATSTYTALSSNSVVWIQLISDGVDKWYVTGLYY